MAKTCMSKPEIPKILSGADESRSNVDSPGNGAGVKGFTREVSF